MEHIVQQFKNLITDEPWTAAVFAVVVSVQLIDVFVCVPLHKGARLRRCALELMRMGVLLIVTLADMAPAVNRAFLLGGCYLWASSVPTIYNVTLICILFGMRGLYWWSLQAV